MERLGDYQRLVVEVFRREAGKAFANGYLQDSPARKDPMELPHLKEALEAVGPDCAYPDDAAQALSQLADRLARKAEASRGDPDYIETAIAMGWARTAAVRVWDLPSSGFRPS